MPDLLPPTPPVLLNDEDNPARRVHFRFWQVVVTLVTIVLTVWFFTLGVAPGIAFAFIAKHILVAVLTAGLHYPRDESGVK